MGLSKHPKRSLSSKDKEELKKFTRYLLLINKRRAEGVPSFNHSLQIQCYKEIYGTE